MKRRLLWLAALFFTATTLTLNAQVVKIYPIPQSITWGSEAAFENSASYTITGEGEADADAEPTMLLRMNSISDATAYSATKLIHTFDFEQNYAYGEFARYDKGYRFSMKREDKTLLLVITVTERIMIKSGNHNSGRKTLCRSLFSENLLSILYFF